MATEPFAKTILLVDDDAIVAHFQAIQIEALGFRVITSFSSNEAVELGSRQNELDLILLDIDMGRQMDGPQVAREILSSRDIPIIFLAPNSSPEMLEKVRGIPRYGFLVKDAPAVTLQAALETAFVLFESHQAEQWDETRWRLALEGSRTGAWDWDLQTNQLYLSPELRTILGYYGDEYPNTITTWIECVHPEDQPACKAAMQKYLDRELPIYENEHRILTNDGHYCWILDRGKVVQYSSDGKPLRVAGICTDIAAHKNAEIRLREKLTRLEFAVEGSGTGIWETHIPSSTNYFSPLVLELLGFAPGELPDNDTWYKNIHPDDFRILNIVLLRHLSGETPFFEFEFRVSLNDGSIRWMYARGKTIEYTDDGQPLRMLGTAVDISERKRVEAALLESEELFHNLFNNHTAVMYQVDPADGTLLDANHAAETFYGYTRAQLQSMNIKQINTAPPEKVDWNIRMVNSGEMNTFPAVHRLASGELRSVEVHSTSIRVSGRTLLFSIVQDVTERLKAEEAMQMLLAEKEILIHEVHHRIKNNMTIINSILELHARRIKDPNATAALQDASSRIYNMMLIYDRLYRTDDSLTIHARPYFEVLLADLARVWSGPNRRITIEHEIAEITMDSRLSFPIGIVVNECITNACKYAFFEQDEGKIRVSLRQDDEMLHLSISDNGTGLPEAINVENPSSFGLMLVNIMVSQLKAKLQVSRTEGTRFQLAIPL